MRLMSVLLLFVLSTSCMADAGEHDAVSKALERAFPGARVTEVLETPVKDVLRVQLNGTEWVNVSADGRYLFSGDIYELRGPKDLVNLSEKQLEGPRSEALAALDMDDVITFPAEDEKADVFVFTDVNCGYCQRLHRQMNTYNDLGITVHYLAFPRGGAQAETAETMRAVWCDKDPRAALTATKLQGISLTPKAACAAPVEEQYKMGLTFGVRGTPAIYTPDGRYLGGYLDPMELAVALDLREPVGKK